MTEDLVENVTERLLRYRERDMRQVQGWFTDESAEVMATLLAHQVETDIRGDIAEIGVHHGKSFLLLANGLRDDERAVALDVFGLQDKNVDRSGLGDRARFEANAAAFAAAANIHIVEASSLDVTPDSARTVFGDVRFMSIDGGHTADITAHDLGLAEACVTDAGVIVLDDVLNAHWLGVASGLFRFLDGSTALVPFAYSENKLYLATSSDGAARYAAVLREAHPDLLGKPDVEFHGGTLDVYGQSSPRRKAAVDRNARAAIAARARDEKLEADLRQVQQQLTASRTAADTSARSAAAAQARIKTLQSDLKKARKAATRAQKRVAAMESSHSWRVTAPLRALTDRARHRSV